MSEDIKTTTDDVVKNLKSEMDRKLTNIQADLQKSNKELADRLAAIAANLSPKAPVKTKTDEDKELESLVWDNPAEYKNRILKEADSIADAKIQSYVNTQAQNTKQLSELYSMYPELQQPNHGLSARAVEVYNSLSAEEKASSSAFKLAVSQAASEYGIKPISKRSEDELDDFTLKSTGRSRKGSEQKITKETELYARFMGIDVDDPKVKKELETYAARKPHEWTRYK